MFIFILWSQFGQNLTALTLVDFAHSVVGDAVDFSGAKHYT